MVQTIFKIPDKNFKRNKNVQYYELDLKLYEETYSVLMYINSLVGLRVLKNDSPKIRNLWNVFYWFEFTNLFIVTWLELANMVETAKGGSFKDAVQIFRMMPCLGYVLMAMTKSYKVVIHREIYENLINELGDMWPKGQISKEEYRLVKKSLRQLHYVVKGYHWCNIILLVVFLSPSFVVLMKRWAGFDEPLILPFFYWFPFDPYQNTVYEVTLAFQTWHGIIVVWLMVCSDLMFCIFISHISTQFDLLSLRIQGLVLVPTDQQLIKGYPLAQLKKEKEHSLNIESECYDELIKIIIRHKSLIRLSSDVESLFSFSMLVCFLNSSIIICFCGFCAVLVEKWNEIIYKAFLVTVLLQTWLLSWHGQRLKESSTNVSAALYNSGWYVMSNKMKRTMILMLHRAQKEIHITTYGFSIIDLSSYTIIVKSSWSYFTLLLNLFIRKNQQI